VYDAEALIADPHVRERGIFTEIESPADGAPLLQAQVHPRMSVTPGEIRHAGLPAGACTEQVLEELGYAADEIDELAASGAVGAPLRAPAGSFPV
jgi:crotonobetainyl-CoA:carnitine CoA-transferase CaiB-like acyl-CoA transferase